MLSFLLPIIYISFISLGLPDALLGAAWPTMYQQFSVPVSYAGVLSAIISLGTIASSLMSDRLTHRLGTGRVTAVSVAATAAALFGFSVSGSFASLCLWAVPYGLGAGSVDASLNNYVALHYASRHMSWLHCMWGLGASAGPYIMGFALSGGGAWNTGYRYIALLQVALTFVLFLSLPLWKRRPRSPGEAAGGEAAPLTLGQIIRIPGAAEVLVTFFCYCALEQTAGLWASSCLVLHWGMEEETAAGFACLFYMGITLGRFLSGFMTMKFSNPQMIRMGQSVVAAGCLLLLLPWEGTALAGFSLVGLGCAPIYPCVIHSTPVHFGPDKSQAVIGVQMACAYVGTCLAPPVFGLIANHVSAGLLPVYLGAILLLMAVMYKKLLEKAPVAE